MSSYSLEMITPDIPWLNDCLSLEQCTRFVSLAFRMFIAEPCLCVANRPQDSLDRMLTEEEETFPSQEQARLAIGHFLELIGSLSRSLIKPKLLQRDLMAAGLSEEKASSVADLWNVNASTVIDRLKEVGSFGVGASRPQLTNVHWKVKVATASSQVAHLAEPLGEVILELNERSTTWDGANNITTLPLTFSPAELATFYENIEQIQTQLDRLQE